MITLTIPGTLPGMNDIIAEARKSRWVSAEQKKYHTELVKWSAIQAKLPKVEGRVNIHITWYEKSKQRDPDNIHAGTKFLLDGLVQAGVIKNDTQRYIGKIDHDEIRVDRNRPRVEIEITEVGG